MPVSSRPVALSATLLVLASPTRSALTCTGTYALSPRWRNDIADSPLQYLRSQDRPGRGLLVHCCQRVEGHYMGREHSLRVPREPQEGTFRAVSDLRWRRLTSLRSRLVHPWHEDGVRGSQEGQGPQRPRHLPQGGRKCPAAFRCPAKSTNLVPL